MPPPRGRVPLIRPVWGRACSFLARWAAGLNEPLQGLRRQRRGSQSARKIFRAGFGWRRRPSDGRSVWVEARGAETSRGETHHRGRRRQGMRQPLGAQQVSAGWALRGTEGKEPSALPGNEFSGSFLLSRLSAPKPAAARGLPRAKAGPSLGRMERRREPGRPAGRQASLPPVLIPGPGARPPARTFPPHPPSSSRRSTGLVFIISSCHGSALWPFQPRCSTPGSEAAPAGGSLPPVGLAWPGAVSSSGAAKRDMRGCWCFMQCLAPPLHWQGREPGRGC